MSDLFSLMAAPFAVCVILVGIHAYLGMHVIQRRVIFVDLALAQIAALGATFSFLLGMSPHGRGAYFLSLGFAIVGAAIFALTRMRNERVPQEAIIGIVYAVALASAILVADRAPEGAEHIKDTMVGAVLWVTWPTVIKTAVIYALVGAIHIALRKRFIQVSFDPEQAYAEGRWVRLWDFIFYITFAFVITSSVAIAGVLLVFTFLVIPAVVATLFATTIPGRLATGWTVGIAACLIGMIVSYRFDMPSGPAVVSSLGVVLILAALVYYVRKAERTGSAVLRVLAGTGAVVGAVAVVGVLLANARFLQVEHRHEWESGPVVGTTAPASDPWQAARGECGGDATCIAAALDNRADGLATIASALASGRREEQERALDILEHLENPRRFDLIAEAAKGEPDAHLRLRHARLLAEGGDLRGFGIALGLLREHATPFVRDAARRILVDRSGQDYGYDLQASAQENAPALAGWSAWLEAEWVARRSGGGVP